MPATTLSRDQVKLLVNLYKLQPTLYSVNSPLYKDKNARDIALRTIGEQFFIKTKIKLTTAEIRTKLNSLRTQFNEHNRTYETAILHSGMGTEDVEAAEPTWWLWDDLKFIRSHIATRPSVSALQSSTSEEGDSQVLFDGVVEGEGQWQSIEDNTDELFSPIQSVSGISSTSRIGTPAPSLPAVNMRNKKRKSKEKNHVDDVRENFYKHATNILENLGNATPEQPNKKNDDITAFLTYVESEMRSFKYKQTFQAFKREVIRFIHNAQDEELSE